MAGCTMSSRQSWSRNFINKRPNNTLTPCIDCTHTYNIILTGGAVANPTNISVSTAFTRFTTTYETNAGNKETRTVCIYFRTNIDRTILCVSESVGCVTANRGRVITENRWIKKKNNIYTKIAYKLDSNKQKMMFNRIDKQKDYV